MKTTREKVTNNQVSKKNAAKGVTVETAKNLFEKYKQKYPGTKRTYKDFLKEPAESKKKKKKPKTKSISKNKAKEVSTSTLKNLSGKIKEKTYSAIESGADKLIGLTESLQKNTPEEVSDAVMTASKAIGVGVGGNIYSAAGAAEGLLVGALFGPVGLGTALVGGLMALPEGYSKGAEAGGDVGKVLQDAPSDIKNKLSELKGWAQSQKGGKKASQVEMPENIKENFLDLITYITENQPELMDKYLTETGEFKEDAFKENLTQTFKQLKQPKTAYVKNVSISELKEMLSKYAAVEEKHLPQVAEKIIEIYKELDKKVKAFAKVFTKLIDRYSKIEEEKSIKMTKFIYSLRTTKALLERIDQILSQAKDFASYDLKNKKASLRKKAFLDNVLSLLKDHYGKILITLGVVGGVAALAKKYFQKPVHDKLYKEFENTESLLDKTLVVPKKLGKTIESLDRRMPSPNYFKDSPQEVRAYFEKNKKVIAELSKLLGQTGPIADAIIDCIFEIKDLKKRAMKGNL